MKNLSFLLIMVFVATFGFAQQKQNVKERVDFTSTKSVQSDWAMVTNFTATDIDGVEHNLQSYLDAGKYVIVDLSCAWCSPCWTLHQSGVLDGLYDTYGPDGTDELMVLWVEIESTNTLAQITGTTGTTGNAYADNTQGDWTEGGTWPVPIIDDASVRNSFLELYSGGVPSVFMVCPSGAYKDVTNEAWTSVAAVYGTISGCPTDTDVPEADFSGSLNGFINTNMSFTNESFSVSSITSYNWTFESGTPATSTDENPTVQWSTAGTYDVTLEVTNANGSNSTTKSVEVIDPGNVDDYHVTFEECIVGSEFATDFAPYGWTSLDNDGGNVYTDFSDYGVSGPSTFVVYSHALANEKAPAAGDKAGFVVTTNPPPYNDDWFISPLLQLGTGSTMSLDVLTGNDTWGLEKYHIMVSTTNNSPNSFTDISGEKEAPNTWTNETFNLGAYDNQEVYIAVNYTGEDTFYFMIDNIDVNTTVDSELEEASQLTIYPNPTTGMLRVNNVEGAQVQVLNHLGQTVVNIDNANANNAINLSEFSDGTYIVKIIMNDQVATRRIVLTK